MCLQLFPPLVIYAAAVGRLEQNNLPWLTDREERNGRNHYFPVKIFLKQRGAELCMLRGVFGPLINSGGPISPSKAFLIISPVEKAALNAVEMILHEHVCLCLGDLRAFCKIVLLNSSEIHWEYTRKLEISVICCSLIAAEGVASVRNSNSWSWLECEKASRFATLAKPDILPVQLVT